MRRKPVIRHFVALYLVCIYTYRAVFIWGLTDVEQLKNHPAIKRDRRIARLVFFGRI